jgi:SAM-dependent methyltransferase
MSTFDGGAVALASRHADTLESLEESHLDWTLDVSMDEEATDKPAILSPFLPSQAATIDSLLSILENNRTLQMGGCILDVGCGDGRVLVAACQRFQCRGVGLDVSPDCIAAAEAMVKLEDELALSSAESQHKDSATNFGTSPPLSSLITWVCADCTKDTALLASLAMEHRVNVVYMYIYPTLLAAIQPQVEELSQMRLKACEGDAANGADPKGATVADTSVDHSLSGKESAPHKGRVTSSAESAETSTGAAAASMTTTTTISVITAGYHFASWPAAFDAVVAPRDSAAGPNSRPVELRLWHTASIS